MADVTSNIELLRALKRMGIEPSETQEIVIHIKPCEPITLYVKSTDPANVTDLIITIVDSDYQVLWEAKEDVPPATPTDDKGYLPIKGTGTGEVTLDVHNSVIT